MKKTISVMTLLKNANRILALPSVSQDEKKAVSSFIENVLHETGNYAGFNYYAPPPDIYNFKEYDRFYLIHKNLK